MDPPPPSIRIRIRRGPEWLLLVSVLLAGAVGVAVLNRWPSISGLQVLELLAAAAVYLAHTVAGERYMASLVSLPARVAYFSVQIVLASAVLYLIARLGVLGSAVFVFVPVLAQAVSLSRWPLGTAAVTVVCLAIFLAILFAQIGPRHLAEAAIGYLLMASFIVIMMRNVLREREARYQIQALADQLQAYVDRAATPHGPTVLPEPLTARETQVLHCLCRGMSNKAIAETLHLAEGTVKNHMTSVLGKLGVRDRTQAALKARDLGLA